MLRPGSASVHPLTSFNWPQPKGEINTNDELMELINLLDENRPMAVGRERRSAGPVYKRKENKQLFLNNVLFQDTLVDSNSAESLMLKLYPPTSLPYPRQHIRKQSPIILNTFCCYAAQIYHQLCVQKMLEHIKR
jgi:hypothetical protein